MGRGRFLSLVLWLGRSIVKTLISAVGIWNFFLPSVDEFNPRAVDFGMTGFLALSGFIIALGETNRLRTPVRRAGVQQRPPLIGPSVGFRGMRERIAQLGGVLEIQWDLKGTLVVATLPQRKAD